MSIWWYEICVIDKPLFWHEIGKDKEKRVR